MNSCVIAVPAEDVYDAILRAGARLNLPILPLAEHIAGQKWDLPSPPPKASPWVDELCMHLQMFRERLRQVKSLSDSNLRQVVNITAVIMLPVIMLKYVPNYQLALMLRHAMATLCSATCLAPATAPPWRKHVQDTKP